MDGLLCPNIKLLALPYLAAALAGHALVQGLAAHEGCKRDRYSTGTEVTQIADGSEGQSAERDEANDPPPPVFTADGPLLFWLLHSAPAVRAHAVRSAGQTP